MSAQKLEGQRDKLFRSLELGKVTARVENVKFGVRQVSLSHSSVFNRKNLVLSAPHSQRGHTEVAAAPERAPDPWCPNPAQKVPSARATLM